MDDLLSEFLTETSESLSALDVALVELERNPNDRAILQNIFRLVHTIKGTCGFLGLPRLERVAHAAENVLGKIRDGELEVTVDAVTLVLQSIDCIKMILNYLEQKEEEPPGDDGELIEHLNAMAEGRAVTPVFGNGEQPSLPEAAAVDELFFGVSSPEETSILSETPEQSVPETEKPESAKEDATPEPEESAPVDYGALEALGDALVATEPVAAPSTAVAAASGRDVAAQDGRGSVVSQSIRVNVELLENLMTLVSELVLTRNQLLQMIRGKDDNEFATPLQRLSHITTDIQESVMKTRMQPIGNAWAKLPRIVRDLAHEMNKKIDLQMLGADTELDRQILELVKDPLTHMVRNSADHGLETPDERRAAGKPETGKIVLNAYHEGGHIIVEIADDGRGLNIAKIREKVVAKGLASEAEVEAMTEQQIAQYIFRAGLSTAEKVTAVSGRGVGMDVVRANIEKIGGTVELKTSMGRGSTFIIKIPLTLAIVSALVVECSGERFAIPQISVLELVRVTPTSEHSIETINNAPVLRLRDRLLPLVSLRKLLKLDQDDGARGETFIIVTQVGNYSFGIIVDKVFDTEEIVVKPVAPILRNIPIFSGNTILGDGSVVMILDPNGIASTTGETTLAGATQTLEGAKRRDSRIENKTSLLVFRSGSADLKAVPLALVARLEEVDTAKIEYSQGTPVVQYRGYLMPLLTIDGTPVVPKGDARQPVLVFSEQERNMGLMVDEIVDIVEDNLKIELAVDRPGLLGTAVIAGKATDVIDAGHYLLQAFGDWFANGDEEAFGSENYGKAKRILLVDDSPFFRNLLTPLLSVAGYDVIAIEGAERALELRDSGEEFDLIISDIEMPLMNGFDFAVAIRQEGPWSELPIVALSSHISMKDFERGRQVGFTDYVAKFDREALLQTLSQIFSHQGAA